MNYTPMPWYSQSNEASRRRSVQINMPSIKHSSHAMLEHLIASTSGKQYMEGEVIETVVVYGLWNMCMKHSSNSVAGIT